MEKPHKKVNKAKKGAQPESQQAEKDKLSSESGDFQEIEEAKGPERHPQSPEEQKMESFDHYDELDQQKRQYNEHMLHQQMQSQGYMGAQSSLGFTQQQYYQQQHNHMGPIQGDGEQLDGKNGPARGSQPRIDPSQGSLISKMMVGSGSKRPLDANSLKLQQQPNGSEYDSQAPSMGYYQQQQPRYPSNPGYNGQANFYQPPYANGPSHPQFPQQVPLYVGSNYADMAAAPYGSSTHQHHHPMSVLMPHAVAHPDLYTQGMMKHPQAPQSHQSQAHAADEGKRHKHFLTDQERLLPLANIREIMQDCLGIEKGKGRKYMADDRFTRKAASNNASELLWQDKKDSDLDDDGSNCGAGNGFSKSRQERAQHVDNYTSLTAAMGAQAHAFPDPDCMSEATGTKVSKISKVGVETVQEFLTEFILFVTSEALDKATEQDRRTIQAQDILAALQELGFDQYHYYVDLYNQKYNHVVANAKRAEQHAEAQKDKQKQNSVAADQQAIQRQANDSASKSQSPKEERQDSQSQALLEKEADLPRNQPTSCQIQAAAQEDQINANRCRNDEDESNTINEQLLQSPPAEDQEQ